MHFLQNMNPDQVRARIETLSHGTQAQVMDLTGTQDHYQALVVSPMFEGKMMLDQHKLIMDLFKREMETGEVHALTLKTYSPAQLLKFSGSETLY